MDMVWLIDTYGEPQTAALIGFGLALAFGFIAERSGFCTRSALLEILSGKLKSALPLWLLAFATAILLVQFAIYSQTISVGETRFFSTAQSLSGALIGGALFGVGMALARGCSSRLMILGATGNLRALTTVAVMAGVAWATYQGFLTGARDSIGSLASTAQIGGNDLVSLLGLGKNGGLAIALTVFAIAVFFAAKTRLTSLKTIAGVAIGAIIAAGWVLTHSLSTQVFEPVQAESLSFIRPSANAINLIASGADESFISLDTGLFFGIFLGALISSLAFGGFRLRTFGEKDTPHFLRYLAGGALMGFGGILAVGCTIGAGFTGGSVLAISSLLGLASMMSFSAITDYALQRQSRQVSNSAPAILPAE